MLHTAESFENTLTIFMLVETPCLSFNSQGFAACVIAIKINSVFYVTVKTRIVYDILMGNLI